MPFLLTEFAAARPYLFHLTATENVPRIQHTRELRPAAFFLQQAGASQLLRNKRQAHLSLPLSAGIVHIRDQKPLHRGNAALPAGWEFGELVQLLNERVFFWPGTRSGIPIPYGERHYERYSAEDPKILRVPTADLFGVNGHLAPEFCRYNSGSPRCSKGHPSPRGPSTFVSCNAAQFSIGGVVEVTFRGAVALPASTQRSGSLRGPWIPL